MVERQQVLQSLVQPVDTPAAVPEVMLTRMIWKHLWNAFMEVHLLILLSGEAQLTAQQLSIAKLLEQLDLKWAILQQVGHTLEQQHQHFHVVTLRELVHPFAFSQQLWGTFQQ